MSLEPEELVSAAEATRETLARVTSAAASLTTEQENAVRLELQKYEDKKDKIGLELRGAAGLYTLPNTLIEEIRRRIRKHFGWSSDSPEMSGAAAAHVGGITKSGKRAVEADSDRARPSFTRDLFG